MNTIRVFYGSTHNKIDITTVLYTFLYYKNYIFIPRNDNYRSYLFGDPAPKVKKHIFIYLTDKQYKLNDDVDIYIDLTHSKIYLNNMILPEKISNIYSLTFNPKICYITAIYGAYEQTCKKFKRQYIESDFICFTNNKNIISNGWIIDDTTYHLTNNPNCNADKLNSIKNNSHTFNIAKYYKTSWHNIPVLKKYDIVVWLDGTMGVNNSYTSNILVNIFTTSDKKMITYNHSERLSLKDEVIGSNDLIEQERTNGALQARYQTTFWFGQKQPFQDINNQYKHYIENGYNDSYFTNRTNINAYVFVTCFVAFLNTAENHKFLDLWYEQILNFTTQDQISYPYVCSKLQTAPYVIPDNKFVHGSYWKSNVSEKNAHRK